MAASTRLTFTIWLCLLSMIVTPTLAETTAIAAPDSEASSSEDRDSRSPVSQARDHVFGAVVSIVTIVESHEGGRARLARTGGSGTIISKAGHIVTNAHVTMNGTKFKVILADKTELEAELIGADPLSDIAVLKFDPGQLPANVTPNVAHFGDSDEVEIGDTVLAMGAPWGMSHSMSLGIVNNNRRLLSSFFEDDADYESDLDRDQPTGSFYRWIQHDAAIAPGNSGGPLVSLKGEIIGVNTRGIPMGGDIGFASPSNVVKDVALQLIEHGEVIRSFLGLQFKPIQTTENNHGVLVNSVVEDSPADIAGLRPGDLILAINGGQVTVRYKEQMPEIRRSLSDLPVGSELRISYQRNNEEREAQLTTKKYEKDVGPRLAVKDWGITLREMTPRMARNRRLSNADGLLVTSVALGGTAATAKPDLEAEDVIRAVDGKVIPNLDAFVKWLDIQPVPSETILLEFERDGARLLTVLKPREEERDHRPREIDKAWLPVEVQAFDASLTIQRGFDDSQGFRITRVYEEAFAAQSGLAVGDVITAIGDEPLQPRSPIDTSTFYRALRRLNVGDTVELHILRNEEPRTLAVELLPTPRLPDEAARVRDRSFDLEVRDVTFFDVAKNRWDTGTNGVIVTDVETGGWAGIGHLRVDDLILQINDEVILDVDQFATVLHSLGRKELKTVRLLIMRGIETRLLYLQPDWKSPTKAKE